MFVGISAGRLGALVTKVPFTKDASGRLLQRCLNTLGFSKSDEYSLQPELSNCYVTNLVKGRILDKDGLNRLPTVKEVEYWWPTFLEEYYKVQPQRILSLSQFVYQELRIRGIRSVKLNHPRWYQSHGALTLHSFSFQKMVEDYRKALA
jgi:uracil-DNA glycosylase